MHWIYLSPHFDDVALSCGGLVWTQVQHGDRVSIWTICAGIPDPAKQPFSPFAQTLHERWGTGSETVLVRQSEDAASCQVMGADYHHLPLSDCIYRSNANGEAYYASEAALTGPLHPQDAASAQQLSQLWRDSLPRRARLVCPLSLGNHVDHQLTRRAAEMLDRQLWYYADYPYVLKRPEQLAALAQTGWQRRHFKLTPAALAAWQNAVAAHASQISTFWSDELDMRLAITDYAAQEDGVWLWRRN